MRFFFHCWKAIFKFLLTNLSHCSCQFCLNFNIVSKSFSFQLHFNWNTKKSHGLRLGKWERTLWSWYFLPKIFGQKERGGGERERERERETSTLSVQEFLAENNISLVFSSIFPSDWCGFFLFLKIKMQ